MKQLVSIICMLPLVASCRAPQRAQVMDVGALAVAAPLVPVVAGYRIVNGTNYTRRLLVPDVYKISDSVIVLSDDGGWFSEGRARYGGRDAHHICLSAWVVDLKSEPRDKKGRIVLSERNLDQLFWEKHDPSALQSIPREVPGSVQVDYFRMKELTPFVTLVSEGSVYEMVLKQD
jgi:hypothetical protein